MRESSVDLAAFAHLCARPQDEIDLGEAALLVGAVEAPRIDVARYLRALDDLGARATERCAGSGEPSVRLAHFLFDDEGFRGNAEDYYDPRNSFLADVLDRRLGIPITLAVVMIEVGRRAGVAIQGVAFPGHFLVRAPTRGGALLIDPFSGGRVLDRATLRALFAQATGLDRDPDPRFLRPATKHEVLARMLRNLRAIYLRVGDTQEDRRKVTWVAERIAVLEAAGQAAGAARAEGEGKGEGTPLLN